MTRWTLLLIMLTPAILWAGTAAGPRITVPEVRHDFGMVKAGARLEHLFLVRNEGAGELQILKVQPS